MFSVMFWGFKAHFLESFPPLCGMFSCKLSELLSHLPSSVVLHTKHLKFPFTISYFGTLFKIQSKTIWEVKSLGCVFIQSILSCCWFVNRLIVFSCELCVIHAFLGQTIVTSQKRILLVSWRQSSKECVQGDLNERASDSVAYYYLNAEELFTKCFVMLIISILIKKHH